MEVCAVWVLFQLLLLVRILVQAIRIWRGCLTFSSLITCARTLRPAHVIVMLTPSMWFHCSNLWHWRIHTLMSYSWNTTNGKDVLTHWSPAPSSGARWEGGGIWVQYLQWPFPLTGEGPMGKNWRRQTMNNRVQGWATVPAQRVPLRDVDYRRLRGHSKDQGTSSGPSGPHPWHLLKAKSHVLLAVVLSLFNNPVFDQTINFSFTINTRPQFWT